MKTKMGGLVSIFIFVFMFSFLMAKFNIVSGRKRSSIFYNQIVSDIEEGGEYEKVMLKPDDIQMMMPFADGFDNDDNPYIKLNVGIL